MDASVQANAASPITPANVGSLSSEVHFVSEADSVSKAQREQQQDATKEPIPTDQAMQTSAIDETSQVMPPSPPTAEMPKANAPSSSTSAVVIIPDDDTNQVTQTNPIVVLESKPIPSSKSK